ncbi:hypothetical protein F1C16_04655 [Hymenobacter sp. NBH84]|uniref:AsmA-like C-terminal region-containing protein n=1 Tax=Hymenobacter sp. NBH84 TaxID=2596915 RepID=UPI001628FC28|nr:AsmA-like C-terminal region-containing protein [Hymenobacter sp. NBH84]QNE38897.1 hypothetical protein F1C16_04655 [Hymenobacter sp. NBH84]
MKFFTFWRLLAAGFVLLLLLLLGGVWLLGSTYGREQAKRLLRQRVSENTDLVVSRFEVDFSPLRDFPHFTISVRNFGLTDTAHQQLVPVLRVGRADAHLELSQILRGKVRVTRLQLTDVFFHQQVDSLGRQWDLRGKRRHEAGSGPPLNFKLDSLVLRRLHLSTRNDYKHSTFAAMIHQARLSAVVYDGQARLRGTLAGQLQYLRTRGNTLFAQEPVQAQIRYRYDFRQRQGKLWQTYATLNGDTVRVGGTHTAATDRETGSRLNLRMVGQQPLLDVLRTALPPNLHAYLADAHSPSKAHIRYTIQGLSGPTTRPHNVLTFRLRNARVVWPDSGRAIRRWDLLGRLDNGPAHAPATTTLSLPRCRIYSSAGKLDAELTLHNFVRPYLVGRVRGQTELRSLATIVAPGLWKAQQGTATLDLRLRGPLPTGPNPARALPAMRMHGTIGLHNANFVVPTRHAHITNLNVQLGLQDSLWTLRNLSGQLAGMRFRANARTVYLLDYLTDQYPTTTVSGRFVVEELHVPRLRYLLARPAQKRIKAAGKGNAAKAMTRYANLFPTGLHLNVQLRCNQLTLPSDTLHDLAVQVRHDGRRVQLTNLTGRVWGGQVSGQASWPTDTTGKIRPVDAQLALRFGTINYRQLLTRLSRPAGQKRAARRAAGADPDPSLRELLLESSGQLTCEIDRVNLLTGENLRKLRLRFDKQGPSLRVPYLTFRTSDGGTGRAQARADIEGLRLTSAHADVDFTYRTLNVQRLLRLLAGLNPPDDLFAPRSPAKRAARRAEPAWGVSPLFDGTITAQVRVRADRVRYAVLQGTQFRLRSTLQAGSARVEECTLQAFGGDVALRGRLRTDAEMGHHPLHVQTRLRNVQLPALAEVAEVLNLNALSSANVRGTMQCEADLRTDLDAEFLPHLSQTLGYLKTDIQNLELLNVVVLQDALKLISKERAGHLYFEPVKAEFFLDRGRILIPHLPLHSNLTSMSVSGTYSLNGPANLYVGLNPFQALFGNNQKRVARIQAGKRVRAVRQLLYVNLRREQPGPFKVRLFKKKEQREQQAMIEQEYRTLLRQQPLDTTMRLLQ